MLKAMYFSKGPGYGKGFGKHEPNSLNFFVFPLMCQLVSLNNFIFLHVYRSMVGDRMASLGSQIMQRNGSTRPLLII